MKIKQQLKNLSKPELAVKITDWSVQINKARLDKALGKLKNLKLIYNLRKQISVAKTYENLGG